MCWINHSRHGQITGLFGVLLIVATGFAIAADRSPDSPPATAPRADTPVDTLQYRDKLRYSDKLKYRDKLRVRDTLSPDVVDRLRSSDRLKPEHIERIRKERARIRFNRNRR